MSDFHKFAVLVHARFNTLSEKQDEALKKMSAEDIRKRLEELDK